MKKGEKRIHVNVFETKVDAEGNETKIKIGEKDIYERNRFGGSGAFNMSWNDRNNMPKYNSKRQRMLRGEIDSKGNEIKNPEILLPGHTNESESKLKR